MLTAFVSPYRRDRAAVRSLFKAGDFLEIHCDCPVDICAERDPKDHYRRARAGELANFTGVSARYEVPTQATLRLATAVTPLDDCTDQVYQLLLGEAAVVYGKPAGRT